jgi:hypothetical protein
MDAIAVDNALLDYFNGVAMSIPTEASTSAEESSVTRFATLADVETYFPGISGGRSKDIRKVMRALIDLPAGRAFLSTALMVCMHNQQLKKGLMFLEFVHESATYSRGSHFDLISKATTHYNGWGGSMHLCTTGEFSDVVAGLLPNGEVRLYAAKSYPEVRMVHEGGHFLFDAEVLRDVDHGDLSRVAYSRMISRINTQSLKDASLLIQRIGIDPDPAHATSGSAAFLFLSIWPKEWRYNELLNTLPSTLLLGIPPPAVSLISPSPPEGGDFSSCSSLPNLSTPLDPSMGSLCSFMNTPHDDGETLFEMLSKRRLEIRSLAYDENLKLKLSTNSDDFYSNPPPPLPIGLLRLGQESPVAFVKMFNGLPNMERKNFLALIKRVFQLLSPPPAHERDVDGGEDCEEKEREGDEEGDSGKEFDDSLSPSLFPASSDPSSSFASSCSPSDSSSSSSSQPAASSSTPLPQIPPSDSPPASSPHPSPPPASSSPPTDSSP